MPRAEPGAFTRPVAGAAAAFGGFLDGVQESRVAAWLPTGVPLVAGRIGAVILARTQRELKLWPNGVQERTILAVPRALVDDATWDALAAVVDVVDSGASPDTRHPDQLIATAVHAIEQQRAAEERVLAERWCREATEPLCVDGSIAALGAAAHAPQVVGIVKSHRTLVVDAADLPAVLGLAEGQRSAVVALTGSHHRSTVWTWYLRVRAATPADPLFGLLRIEVADHGGASPRADLVSRWVLAERTPLALPDARWDVMPYGIARCELYLKRGRGLRGVA